MGLGKSSELFVIFMKVLKEARILKFILTNTFCIFITESSGCVKIQKYKQEEKGV